MRIPEKLCSRLEAFAWHVMDSRPADFEIGPEGNRYMHRWYAVPRNKLFNVYIHRFLRDDADEALHDHPWASLSFTVQGVVREYLPMPGTDPSNESLHTSRLIGVGDVTWRGLHFAHRLEVVSRENPITIFMTGPVLREWGFHCPKGWKPWKEFVKNSGVSSERGAGCAP